MDRLGKGQPAGSHYLKWLAARLWPESSHLSPVGCAARRCREEKLPKQGGTSQQLSDTLRDGVSYAPNPGNDTRTYYAQRSRL